MQGTKRAVQYIKMTNTKTVLQGILLCSKNHHISHKPKLHGNINHTSTLTNNKIITKASHNIGSIKCAHAHRQTEQNFITQGFRF